MIAFKKKIPWCLLVSEPVILVDSRSTLNQPKYDVNKESIGLCRDDGLEVFYNIPKP